MIGREEARVAFPVEIREKGLPVKTVVTVVGARPQFIKAGIVSRAIREANSGDGARQIGELLVHTGQHYDSNMSDIFFDELQIPRPSFELGIGSGSHGSQTGRMLEKMEEVLQKVRPDLIVVYGDTNSTVAGALAAAKSCIPLAHVEAGLRSFNRRMPEEVNRVLTDHVSTLLFCPTLASMQNLKTEGIPDARIGSQVYHAGDVMYDAAILFAAKAGFEELGKSLNLRSGEYILGTVHRAENTGSEDSLNVIFEILDRVGKRFGPLVLPMHPRTRAVMERSPSLKAKWLDSNRDHLRLLPPLGYHQMMAVEKHAKLIMTDSGGVQKEAFFHGVPGIVLRNETEWVELEEAGWNFVTGINADAILEKVDFILRQNWRDKPRPLFYGDGQAGKRIAFEIARFLYS